MLLLIKTNVMEAITSRIKELIENTGLTNKEFAEKIDVSPAIISHILSGRNNPSLQVIQRITNVYTNVNLNYLLSGEGVLYRVKPPLDKDGPSKSVQEINASGDLPSDSQEASKPFKRDTSNGKHTPPPVSSIKETMTMGQQEDPEKQLNTNVNQGGKHMLSKDIAKGGKEIERVIIFYSDKTIEEYRP